MLDLRARRSDCLLLDREDRDLEEWLGGGMMLRIR